MPIEKTKPVLLPSILDRLISDTSETVEYSLKTQEQILYGIYQSVRRDLESLLNTKKRCLSWPMEWQELELSLVDYGLPDYITSVQNTTASQENFCRIIENTIKRYETRFKDVVVQLIKNVDRWDHCMRFQIKALLYVESTTKVLIYHSRLDAERERFFIDAM